MELANDSASSQTRCPSCGSDQWKSAKTVVLEGTTMSKGKLEGTIRDKGMFGGGVRSFLLSDRWFSRDHALNADISFGTVTALAESIRDVLIAQGEGRPWPSAPVPAKKIGFFQKVRPVRPSRPEKPQLPPAPVPPKNRHWRTRFREDSHPWLKAVVASILAGLNVRFSDDYGWGYSTTTIVAFFAGIYVLWLLQALHQALNGDQRDQEDYKTALEEHRERLGTLKPRHEEALVSFKKQMIKYEEDLVKARAQEDFEADELARFERELAAFEKAKTGVAVYRETLWDLSCVCSRCANVYLRAPASPSKSLPQPALEEDASIGGALHAGVTVAATPTAHVRVQNE